MKAASRWMSVGRGMTSFGLACRSPGRKAVLRVDGGTGVVRLRGMYVLADRLVESW